MSVPEIDTFDTPRGEGATPSPRRAVWAIGFGLALALLSTLVWAATKVAPSAGDVRAIESSLSADGPGEASPGTSPTTPVDESPFRFTIPTDATDPAPAPLRLRIPDLGEDAEVIPVGVAPDGEMEIPDQVDQVAWYRYGPSPGTAGSAVLAAHVDLAGQGPGVFFQLRTLEPGAVIFVDFDDGSSSAFQVTARQTYLKDELPLDLIFSRNGAPVLTLVTCGGDFNRSLRRYDSNVVVFARPFEASRTTTAG